MDILQVKKKKKRKKTPTTSTSQYSLLDQPKLTEVLHSPRWNLQRICTVKSSEARKLVKSQALVRFTVMIHSLTSCGAGFSSAGTKRGNSY